MGGKTRRREVRRFIMNLLVFMSFLYAQPRMALAAGSFPGYYGRVNQISAPARTALPAVLPGSTPAGAKVEKQNGNSLLIEQSQYSAVIDWESFDIGEDARVLFNQQGNKDWSALNRIYSADPSRIFGSLKADGRIYLINQNGILFGGSARVNTHALVASSRPVTTEDFLAGTIRFIGEGTGVISNHGAIETDDNGTIMLFGSEVENFGTLNAPSGSVVLLAGNKALFTGGAGNYSFNENELDTGDGVTTTFGPAGNYLSRDDAGLQTGGIILADSGQAAIYGSVVNQQGLVRAVTALKKAGKIQLKASEQIITGPESRTICPISSSLETGDSSFQPRGSITLSAGSDEYAGGILHQGVIAAPGGSLELLATGRILLDTGSSIDASGVWAEKAAGANILTAQLNSIQLRDDYNQKEGVLKGEEVSFNATTGTSFGDTSGTLDTVEVTAMDQCTTGGTITITAQGDIIAKQGSGIDFSGGGTFFTSGTVDTTMLLSGNRIYDIGTAPEDLAYDRVFGLQEKTYARFGMTDTFTGMYYGGGSPLRNYAGSYYQGSDAGTLSLTAPRLVFEGALRGSALAGPLQTMSDNLTNEAGLYKTWGLVEPEAGTLIIGSYSNLESYTNLASTDHKLQDLTLTSEGKGLQDDAGLETDLAGLAGGGSYILSGSLGDAGLKTLQINANTGVTLEEGTDLRLAAGGDLSITSRRIESSGTISVPSGNVTLALQENHTYPGVWDQGTANEHGNTAHVQVQERIVVNGTIDVSGLKTDNSMAGRQGVAAVSELHTAGGTVTLRDRTVNTDSPDDANGVLLTRASTIDVSGGYSISEKGRTTGADAGALSIQGSTVVLDGELRGYSLAGGSGGTFSLKTHNLAIGSRGDTLPEGFTPGSSLPENLRDQVHFQADRLDGTGFTRISLASSNGFSLENGTTLSPSCVKMVDPLPGGGIGAVDNYRAVEASTEDGLGEKGLFRVDRLHLGASAVTLQAGITRGGGQDYDSPLDTGINNNQAAITVGGNTSLEAAHRGSVTIKAPLVSVAGRISAPGGTISITASGVSTEDGRTALDIAAGGVIDASGYLEPDLEASVGGLGQTCTAVDGGKVSLSSLNDGITIHGGEPGQGLDAAFIDVSGSGTTPVYQAAEDNTVTAVETASDPGSLTISYYSSLDIQGDLKAWHAEGVQGGKLTLARENTALSDAGGLTVRGTDLDRFQEAGFDDMSLKSCTWISFEGDVSVHVDRSLTLDAPVIRAEEAEGRSVVLSAPKVVLTNTWYPASSGTDTSGTASDISLSADWVDVTGAVGFRGFEDVNLSATHDIALSDLEYVARGSINGSENHYKGLLEVTGDLTLTADRIYPTTRSCFTVKSPGTISVPGNPEVTTSGPILSAGGSLTLEAARINHAGSLYAPLGSLGLVSTERVFLGAGSVLSVSGQAAVQYGDLDDIAWTVTDKKDLGDTILTSEVTAAPEKAITIDGGRETVLMRDAVIDASGGGTIYSASFLSGVNGTEDPLAGKGRYVIVPGVSLYGESGKAVRLDGVSGLSAGTYALVPADRAYEYAVLPGAYVIEDLGVATALGSGTTSSEGYPLVTGSVVMPGAEKKSVAHTYTIRPAAEVLREGEYQTREIVAGGGGSIDMAGTTTILAGTIRGQALSEAYEGASLTMSGITSRVRSSSQAVSEDFTADSVISEELKDQLVVSEESISSGGVSRINVGRLHDGDGNLLDESRITRTIEIEEGTTLTASTVTLNAADSITIKEGSAITAPGSDGTVSMKTVSGSTKEASGWSDEAQTDGFIDIEKGALVHAGSEVSIETTSLGNAGTVESEGDGRLSLTSERVVVAHDGTSGSGTDGLSVSDRLTGFSGFSRLGIRATEEAVFRGAASLGDTDLAELSIDSPRVTHDHVESTADTVTLTAGTISLKNTTGSAGSETGRDDSAGLVMNADQISIGHGDMLMDGFGAVDMSAENDLVFRGEGSLTLDGSTNMQDGAKLGLKAARITGTYYRDEATDTEDRGDYEVLGFSLDAGSRSLAVSGTGNDAGDATTPGGSLELRAGSIVQGGVIEVASGTVKLLAEDDIILKQGSQILARGITQTSTGGTSHETAAGRVILTSDRGGITGEAGSVIDVSDSTDTASMHGSITISATEGEVSLESDLSASSGTFSLDASRVGDLDACAGKLGASGFDASVSVRARSGDLSLGQGSVLRSREVTLTADAGSVDIAGTIDASGDEGGTVEVYAGDALVVSGVIDASAEVAEGKGGEVYLAAGQAQQAGAELPAEGSSLLAFGQGSLIDVSGLDNDGNTDAARGGWVYFRAPRTGAGAGTGVAADLRGTVRGAARVAVEPVKKYAYTTISTTGINAMRTETRNFMASRSAIFSSLFEPEQGGMTLDSCAADDIHVLPGIEVDSSGNLTLAGTWDLSPTANSNTTWRFDGEPGMLTLRAAGSITFNTNVNLVDHPNSYREAASSATAQKISDTIQDSWGMTLVSGADLGSADATAVRPLDELDDAGDIIIRTQLVYSESAPVRLSSGRDIRITEAKIAPSYMINTAMKYNVGTFNAPIEINTGRNLELINTGIANNTAGGAVQSALGDIELTVGNDLYLGKWGSVRTTGSDDSCYAFYWDYNRGGSISIDVGGKVQGEVNTAAWDKQYTSPADPETGNTFSWGAVFDSGTNAARGIVTMGGGDILIRTGGDLSAQAGSFGSMDPGSLEILSGGNLDGRFLVRNGDCRLNAMGSFGSKKTSDEKWEGTDQIIEACNADILLAAQGDVRLATVRNPELAGSVSNSKRMLTYAEDSGLFLTSFSGDVALDGFTSPYRYSFVLPGTVAVDAARDISITHDFVLAPSGTGGLSLEAGRDISGNSEGFDPAILTMSDKNPAQTYDTVFQSSEQIDRMVDSTLDSIHAGDDEPVVVKAGRDIRNISLSLPKKADITAGSDITDVYVSVMNLAQDDVSRVSAGRDIILSTMDVEQADRTGIQISGPGTLIVEAGESLDLGTTRGIISTANIDDGGHVIEGLGPVASDLIIASGLNRGMDMDSADEVCTFFDELKPYAKAYSNLSANEVEKACAVVEEAREKVIGPFFGGGTASAGGSGETASARDGELPRKSVLGRGDISMVRSQIATDGESDISILSMGTINVGRSALSGEDASDNTKSGITTQYGGEVNLFTDGTINVYESRIMTLHGGDVLAWSDNGDINAGRGSRTAVSTGGSKKIEKQVGVDADGNPVVEIVTMPRPAATGSGIRTVTFVETVESLEYPVEEGSNRTAAPKTDIEGRKADTPAGDAYIAAPGGIVDAGEAGIAAENVFVGAREVRNSANISAAGVAVGLPQMSAGTGSLGSLTGTGSLNDMASLSEQLTSLSSSATRTAEASEQTYVPRWVKVMVIGFGEEDDPGNPGGKAGPGSEGQKHEKEKDKEKGKDKK